MKQTISWFPGAQLCAVQSTIIGSRCVVLTNVNSLYIYSIFNYCKSIDYIVCTNKVYYYLLYNTEDCVKEEFFYV